MIRIGVVNIDVSHPKAFSMYLEKSDRARYVAVYNNAFRTDEEVDGFINMFGLEKRCRSIEELADMVDVGFVQSCNWDNHLKQATPFIERGKPVFIDKPIVGSLADCLALEEFAAKGAVILGSSSVRYAEEVADFASKSEEEVGKIVHIYASVGVDEFNYAIHAVESMGGLITGAVSTQFVGRGTVDGKAAETFFVRFANGATATCTICLGNWQPFDLSIMTTTAAYQIRVDATKIYAALLDRICDYMETGVNKMAPVSALTESIKIMLAGRISRNTGGAEVKLADIPIDDPGFDGDEFERGYAKNAIGAQLYLAR
ncbi:MAG: Gfo/Idh/MocA family oxidoreductase [Armatimonadota bacterium]|nr:Gfo/Idh/MocA family oxidoreductase [Armatimonadota bacterium]